MTYNILCQVSGGVTGTRSGLLKNNGKIAVFQTHEAAITEAARLSEKMNRERKSAEFNYTAVPCE